MKFLRAPPSDCVLEGTEQETKELIASTGGFMVRHKEACFVLVYGRWLMILPPEEKETETDEEQKS